MKIKGSAINVITAFLILIVFIIIPALFSFAGEANKNLAKELVSKKNFFTVSNSLDAAKYGFLEPALKYSFYQACYDSLKKGGWRKMDDKAVRYQDMEFMPLAGKRDFIGNLEGETLKDLNVYTESGDMAYMFLTQFAVRLPMYDAVKIREGGEGKIEMEAYGGRLRMEEKLPKETTVIEKNSSLKTVAETPCMEMHSAAQEKHENIKGLLEKGMKEEIIKWPVLGAKDAEHQAADEVFVKAAKDAGMEVTGIEDGKHKMEENLKGIRIPAGEGTEGLNTNYILLRNLIKADIKANECEDKTCYNFIYQASVPVGVKLANKNDKDRLPVFNGTDIAFEGLQVNFAYIHEFKHEKGPLTS